MSTQSATSPAATGDYYARSAYNTQIRDQYLTDPHLNQLVANLPIGHRVINIPGDFGVWSAVTAPYSALRGTLNGLSVIEQEENQINSNYPGLSFGSYDPYSGTGEVPKSILGPPSPATEIWLEQHPQVAKQRNSALNTAFNDINSSLVPGYDLFPDINRKNLRYIPSDILADALSQPAGTVVAITGLTKGGIGFARGDAAGVAVPDVSLDDNPSLFDQAKSDTYLGLQRPKPSPAEKLAWSKTPKANLHALPSIGMKQAEFGQLIGWGNSGPQAIARMKSLTDTDIDALAKRGLTKEIARQWANGYLQQHKFIHGNDHTDPKDNTWGRYLLMKYLSERLPR